MAFNCPAALLQIAKKCFLDFNNCQFPKQVASYWLLNTYLFSVAWNKFYYDYLVSQFMASSDAHLRLNFYVIRNWRYSTIVYNTTQKM